MQKLIRRPQDFNAAYAVVVTEAPAVQSCVAIRELESEGITGGKQEAAGTT